MTTKKELQKKIEHLGAFEERVSVRIENISIKLTEYDRIEIFFELYSTTDDNKLKQETKVNVVFYDNDEKILDYNSTFIDPSDFWGFAVDYVRMNTYSHETDKISKIRIYPTICG